MLAVPKVDAGGEVIISQWLLIISWTVAGYFAGLGYGYRRANREYKAAIDQATKDYREASRLVQSMRNRLIAARWLKRRQALKTKKKKS
jgi:hypothetical protein